MLNWENVAINDRGPKRGVGESPGKEGGRGHSFSTFGFILNLLGSSSRHSRAQSWTYRRLSLVSSLEINTLDFASLFVR